MPPILQSLPPWLQLALVVVPALSASFAAGALILNIAQSRRTNAQARATLVASCLQGFADDEDIQRAFYAIEYDGFKYDQNFHKSQQEREIDKLLRHFANLALSWKSGLLTTKDVKPVQYYILRVMQNAEISKYMEFMTNWLKSTAKGQHPYAVLGELTEELSKHLP
jgi:hypothetical protein